MAQKNKIAQDEDTYPITAEIDLVKVEEKIKNFENLLTSLEDLDDKKKALWKEIYTNAVTDRYHAYDMYTDLVVICRGKTSEHSIHASNLAKYMERMSRANDQLIKLAELIADAQKKSESINADDLYKKISSI